MKKCSQILLIWLRIDPHFPLGLSIPAPSSEIGPVESPGLQLFSSSLAPAFCSPAKWDQLLSKVFQKLPKSVTEHCAFQHIFQWHEVNYSPEY